MKNGIPLSSYQLLQTLQYAQFPLNSVAHYFICFVHKQSVLYLYFYRPKNLKQYYFAGEEGHRWPISPVNRERNLKNFRWILALIPEKAF